MAEPRAGLKALQGKKQDTKTGHPFKMGRNRSVATGLRLKFRDYLTKGLPTPPATFDYSPDASSSIANIYDNDTLGDCVIACLGHEVGVVTGNADGGSPFMFTNQQIINLYSAIGGYVPGNPATDQGCDIQTMLNYWVKNGAPSGSNKILGWIAVDPTDMNQVRVALYLFETLIFGIELPDAWVNNMPQASGFTWDVAGAPDPSNGHCICGVSASPQGIGIATWGMTGTITNAAVQQYAGSADGGELYTVITQEMISKATQKAPNGFDFAALVADFDSLGGNVVQPPSEQPDWPNIFAAKA
jgi:hypothetical protein